MANTKNIIITGCDSPVGTAIVKALVDKGHSIYASISRHENRYGVSVLEFLQWARANLRNVCVLDLDVTDNHSVRKALSEVDRDCRGKLDVLINLEEIIAVGLNESLDPGELHRLFQVNVMGADRMIRAVSPFMRKQNSGLIVNLSNVFSRTPLPVLGPYCASKAALEALSVGYFHELKTYGIDVTILQPGIYPSAALQNQLNQMILGWGDDNHHIIKLKESFINNFLSEPRHADVQEIVNRVTWLVKNKNGERPLWNIVGAGKLSAPVEQINNYTQIATNVLLHYIRTDQLWTPDIS